MFLYDELQKPSKGTSVKNSFPMCSKGKHGSKLDFEQEIIRGAWSYKRSTAAITTLLPQIYLLHIVRLMTPINLTRASHCDVGAVTTYNVETGYGLLFGSFQHTEKRLWHKYPTKSGRTQKTTAKPASTIQKKFAQL